MRLIFQHDLRRLRPFRPMATRLDERNRLEGKRILAKRGMRQRKSRAC